MFLRLLGFIFGFCSDLFMSSVVTLLSCVTCLSVLDPEQLLVSLACLFQGDYTAAMASLETCLSVLTRARPSTSLDLVFSISWNLIRYCLHRPTPLGWLVHQVGGKHEGEEARTSARDAALVYHQLSQLQLTGQGTECTACTGTRAADLTLSLSHVRTI